MEVLDYFDVTKHTIYDLAHTFANVIKLFFAIIANRKDASSAKFTPAVRKEEQERGRFAYLDTPGPRNEARRPKWAPKNGRRTALQKAMKASCRVPVEWPECTKPLTNVFVLKTSELLLYAGSAGTWLVAHLGLDPVFTSTLVALLRLLQVADTHRVRTNLVRRTIIVLLALYSRALFLRTTLIGALFLSALFYRWPCTRPVHRGTGTSCERSCLALSPSWS